jgi:ParB family chromosome partitioning protein
MARLNLLNVAAHTGTEASRAVLVKDLPIEEVVIKENIRADYVGIDELKASIRQYGLLQPIMVYKSGEEYVVKTGHRRYLAYRALYAEQPDKYHSIRSIISDAADIMVIQLIENVQREDLSQLDLFNALSTLKQQGFSTKQIAEVMGKSESYIKFLFIGVNEIKQDPALQSYIEASGGAIQDVVETKGIADKDERLNLLEQRTEGSITRAVLREKTRELRPEKPLVQGPPSLDFAAPTAELAGGVLPAILPAQGGGDLESIAGNTLSETTFPLETVCLCVDTERRYITLSFEEDASFERIRAGLQALLIREHIICTEEAGHV